MHPLLDQFEDVCGRFAERTAAEDAALRLTYGELRLVAGSIAGAVQAQTDRPHVGLLFPPMALGAAAIFGCWYAGRVPVPLNFVLAPQELGRILSDAELDCVLTIERFAPAIRAAGLRAVALDVERPAPVPPVAPSVAPHDLAALIYTSGTSGDPKGVRLSFDNIVQNVNACIAAADISPDQRFLSLLPQYHAFGFTTNTVVPLLLGSTVHYLPRFSPVAVVQLVAEHRINVFITIASMFGALATMKDVSPRHLASLNLAVSGGEPLPPRVVAAFEQRFGMRIYEGYGMTEASPVVTLNSPRVHRAGSVGRPLPGVTVIAVDDEGRALPAGADGELVVRGHCVMQGYHHQPTLSATTVRDGALHTGDVGHVDVDGFVFITGRAKDMLIVGGENVFPFEIESVLVEHPAVAEAAVIGVRDEMRGEVPVAFVIPRAEARPPTDSELRAFCRARLASYKLPRQVYVREDLPRGPTGKILKRALRAGSL